ncbi:hypothetical protein GCK32_016505 [Trichostrongylus colubriformis]|uniref:Uncharacterized protein n=1 Tax=Trichostrongylus colubriformis TaxID=6319 RepID=A0AAN8ERE6_TRICO
MGGHWPSGSDIDNGRQNHPLRPRWLVIPMGLVGSRPLHFFPAGRKAKRISGSWLEKWQKRHNVDHLIPGERREVDRTSDPKGRLGSTRCREEDFRKGSSTVTERLVQSVRVLSSSFACYVRVGISPRLSVSVPPSCRSVSVWSRSTACNVQVGVVCVSPRLPLCSCLSASLCVWPSACPSVRVCLCVPVCVLSVHVLPYISGSPSICVQLSVYACVYLSPCLHSVHIYACLSVSVCLSVCLHVSLSVHLPSF